MQEKKRVTQRDLNKKRLLRYMSYGRELSVRNIANYIGVKELTAKGYIKEMVADGQIRPAYTMYNLPYYALVED